MHHSSDAIESKLQNDNTPKNIFESIAFTIHNNNVNRIGRLTETNATSQPKITQSNNIVSFNGFIDKEKCEYDFNNILMTLRKYPTKLILLNNSNKTLASFFSTYILYMSITNNDVLLLNTENLKEKNPESILCNLNYADNTIYLYDTNHLTEDYLPNNISQDLDTLQTINIDLFELKEFIVDHIKKH